ncbi:MAG: AI-2E family transporter [Lachnospiraceae bacterium]|nr:AI-2E family transporter [Agathobacter sp.]MDD6290564.1 AI-2E family transporter [Lachnospiraceae bacterium]
MSEVEKENLTQAERQKSEHKRQNTYLAKIGLMIFITFVCCILFFFCVLRYKGFADGWNKIVSAGQSIIIGLVLAYLLNPIVKNLEGFLYKHLQKKIKTDKKAKKLSRGLGIAGAILFLLVILVLLIAMIVPATISSIAGLVDTLPGNVAHLISTIQNGKLGDFELTDTISSILTKLTDTLEKWATNTLLPQAQAYLLQITSGVITIFKAVMNFVVGIIVAAYVLMIKERLIGQSKKVIFSVFKPKQGNVIVELMHKANEIFGGFIGGKLIDSAIIGVICYLGCCILRIPDAMLVAVIVGVTNIIPVFGPFIGAVPSLLLVVIQSPWHALYLLIFIIILQQVDGNIIGPKILGSSTGLSSFWVMFSILIGGGLFGFLGMLLGVPVFAMIYYILRRLVNYGIEKKHLPLATDDYVEIAGVDETKGSFRYYNEQKKEKHSSKKKTEESKEE